MNTRKTANPKTSWYILPRWVKNWEDFAGKEYVRVQPDGRGETIGDTVRQAQESLAGFRTPDFNDWGDGFWTPHNPEACRGQSCWYHHYYQTIQYPKSLGELCLEAYQDKIQRPELIWVLIYGADARKGSADDRRGPIEDLRRLLYHKNRPKQDPLFCLRWKRYPVTYITTTNVPFGDCTYMSVKLDGPISGPLVIYAG